MIRLALAGGSDGRPPHDEPRNAQIIPFPNERRLQAPHVSPADDAPLIEKDDEGVSPPMTAIDGSSQSWPRVFPGL